MAVPGAASAHEFSAPASRAGPIGAVAGSHPFGRTTQSFSLDVVALILDASTKPGHGDEFVAALLDKVRKTIGNMRAVSRLA